MQIRPTAFTIGLIIYSFIALFFVYTEFGIDSLSRFFYVMSLIIITNIIYDLICFFFANIEVSTVTSDIC